MGKIFSNIGAAKASSGSSGSSGGGGSVLIGIARTGNTLVFDAPLSANYNTETPGSHDTIYLDDTAPLIDRRRTYFSSGEVEPIIDLGETYSIQSSGSFVPGELNLYHFWFDGFRWQLVIQAMGAFTPALPDPNILFIDTFAGTTLDTTNKWDLTNPNPANITFSVNEELIVTSDGTVGISSAANYMLSKASEGHIFDLTTKTVLSFDIKSYNQDSFGGWTIGFSNGTDWIVFYYGDSGTGAFIRIHAFEEGSDIIPITNKAIDLNTYKRAKISVADGTTAVSVYDDVLEEWDELVSVSHNWTTNDMKLRLAQGNNVSDTGPNQMINVYDNIVVCDGEFNSKYPPNTI